MLILLQLTHSSPLNDPGTNEDLYSWNRSDFNTDTLSVEISSGTTRVPTGDPAPADYSRPTSEKFHYTCSGTTETGYYHDGDGGYTTQSFADSVACGFSYPADGTFIRTQCYGYDLYNVVADGSGGERQGTLVEANSTSCGVVYGCTDTTATNYNPLATPGNPDENVCTYTPGALTEVKVIEVRSCPSDGIYLQWYNSLGGVDGWMFQGKIDTLFASEPTAEYNYPNGLRSATGKVLTPSVVVNTSELNYNRFQSICQLFASPLVWRVREDGTHERVYVEAASDLGQRNIGQSSYNLQVRVSLQPLNALKN